MNITLNIAVVLWCKSAGVTDEQIVNAIGSHIGQCAKGAKSTRVSGDRIDKSGTYGATLTEATVLTDGNGREKPVAQLAVLNRQLNMIQKQLGYSIDVKCPESINKWLSGLANKGKSKGKS